METSFFDKEGKECEESIAIIRIDNRDGKRVHFARTTLSGDLIDPVNLTNWKDTKFMKVNNEVYRLYVNYITTKAKRYFEAAERLMNNG